jgi:hypothetical protein
MSSEVSLLCLISEETAARFGPTFGKDDFGFQRLWSTL